MLRSLRPRANSQRLRSGHTPEDFPDTVTMNPRSPAASNQRKRFVILRHHFPDGGNSEFFDHFDLMLEQDSKLATWQLAAIPSLNEAVPAKRLPDHRNVYLDYEGPVSGDRGSVEQVMSGTYDICQTSDSCLEILMTSGDESMRLRIVFEDSDTATISRIVN